MSYSLSLGPFFILVPNTRQKAIRARGGYNSDFEYTRISNRNLAKWISENLVFYQLILEFYDGKDPNSGWVHCSYKKDDTNRGAMLTALRVNGKTQYKKGLLP